MKYISIFIIAILAISCLPVPMAFADASLLDTWNTYAALDLWGDGSAYPADQSGAWKRVVQYPCYSDDGVPLGENSLQISNWRTNAADWVEYISTGSRAIEDCGDILCHLASQSIDQYDTYFMQSELYTRSDGYDYQEFYELHVSANGGSEQYDILVHLFAEGDGGQIVESALVSFNSSAYSYDDDEYDYGYNDNYDYSYDYNYDYGYDDDYSYGYGYDDGLGSDYWENKEITKLSNDKLWAIASSELTDKHGSYPASQACDGYVNTVWSEGVNGFGEGEWLEIRFNPTYILDFMIYGGYQKDSYRYYKNNRPRKIEVWTDDEYQGTIELDDDMAAQYFGFNNPVYTSSLRLKILSVYAGNECDDTCISEVCIFGYD